MQHFSLVTSGWNIFQRWMDTVPLETKENSVKESLREESVFKFLIARRA